MFYLILHPAHIAKNMIIENFSRIFLSFFCHLNFAISLVRLLYLVKASLWYDQYYMWVSLKILRIFLKLYGDKNPLALILMQIALINKNRARPYVPLKWGFWWDSISILKKPDRPTAFPIPWWRIELLEWISKKPRISFWDQTSYKITAVGKSPLWRSLPRDLSNEADVTSWDLHDDPSGQAFIWEVLDMTYLWYPLDPVLRNCWGQHLFRQTRQNQFRSWRNHISRISPPPLPELLSPAWNVLNSLQSYLSVSCSLGTFG